MTRTQMGLKKLGGLSREGARRFCPKKKAEHYTPYTVFRTRRIAFFLVNGVENQNEPKRPQGGGRLGSFWFSTRPTAMGGTDYNGLGL